MSFAWKCIPILLISVYPLTSCNSKHEKTTHPKDPNIPALFAPSDLSDAEKKERIDQAAADLLAAEIEADRELERIKARKAERENAYAQKLAKSRKLTVEQARKDIKGMELDSLALKNGDSFSKIKVLRADDIGLTISHRDGARRIKYNNLPKFIQDKCLYIGSTEPVPSAKNTKQITQPTPKALVTSQKLRPIQINKKISNTHSSEKNPPSKKSQPAHGSITVSVKKTYSRYIRGYGKVHFKQLRIVSKANTDASLYANGRRLATLKSNEQNEHFVESGYHGKYEIKLVGKNGKILDLETDQRKSGLGGARGL